jgi:hypothetical protein
MEATNTSETSVNFFQTTRRNNLEDSHLHTRRHENLKSHHVYRYSPLRQKWICLFTQPKYHVFKHSQTWKSSKFIIPVLQHGEGITQLFATAAFSHMEIASYTYWILASFGSRTILDTVTMKRENPTRLPLQWGFTADKCYVPEDVCEENYQTISENAGSRVWFRDFEDQQDAAYHVVRSVWQKNPIQIAEPFSCN